MSDGVCAKQLSEEYGPGFSLRRGSERVVFVSSYKMVKEALVNQLDSFADRPIIPLFHVVFKAIGEHVATTKHSLYVVKVEKIGLDFSHLQWRQAG